MSQPRTDAQGKDGWDRPAEGPAQSPAEPEAVLHPDDPFASAPAAPEPGDDTPTIISRTSPRVTARAPQPGPGSLRGRRLAHFELIEPIGVGGMAAVLRARDTQLDRPVALKILPPEMAADPENVRRFHQEARSAAKLDHETIARVFFCGEDQQLHFIAFEFVEGENLRTIVERRGRLPVGEALHYMLQVAAGLAHAARRGVVHRDIKPSNIIVTPSGRAKLVDMGLARSLEPRTDAGLTQSGVTLGTFDYISPEQALEPRDADVRSDIYSLGCTFYHVLTGHPPVPEGTAAKKLHHHQHVKPPDPRQFVPDLPHEVCAILGRMMAKQAKDRYQSPEELVHDLLEAARKLGVAPEVPEGLLAVEAALPNRPGGGRSLVLAGLAVCAVVALTLALGQSPQTGPRPVRPRPEKEDFVKDGGAPAADAGPGEKSQRRDKGPGDPVRPAPQVAVYDPAEGPDPRGLAEFGRKNEGADKIEVVLSDDLDLMPPGETVAQEVVLKARQSVTIRAKGARALRSVRFSYDAHPRGRKDPAPRVALTVEAPEVTVEGVRFVVDARESPGTDMVGLLLRGGRQHRVERCEFVQARPALGREARRVASVAVESEGGHPVLNLRDCCFLGFGKVAEGSASGRGLAGAGQGGRDAVVCKGPAVVNAVGCAFGPHTAVFRLEKEKGAGEQEVSVESCSVLAGGRGAVFDLAEGGAAAVRASESLFARLGGSAAPEGEGSVLIRQEDKDDRLSYRGEDNRYHDLDGYWAVGDDWKAAGWKDFAKKVRDLDTASRRVLTASPWRLKPEQQLARLEEGRPAEAFALNPRLASVRLGSGEGLVGVQTLLGTKCVPGKLPAAERAEAGGRFLVVEDDAEDSKNGVYPSLNQAVQSARAGDTILVRSDGRVKLDPVDLNKKGLSDLTVRPFRRFRPLVVLGETTDASPALLRVYDGRLVLEGLEFLLSPGKKFSALSLVELVGDGECLLRGCVVTLDRPADSTTPLAVATLVKGGKVMRTDVTPARAADVGPLLTLEGCLVRGEGDLLWGRGCRPCGLAVKDTLAALGGSFLNVEVPPDAPAVVAGQNVKLELEQVTTYLGGNFIRLAAGKDLKGLVPVQCDAQRCLFLPGPSLRALVHLEGPDTDEKTVKEKLTWKGQGNGYGPYVTMLEQQPTGEEMAPPAMGTATWKKFTEEDGAKFGVKMKALPAERPLAEVIPSDFGYAGEEDTKYGAELKDLPRPSPREK
jgi:hypothetical protein